MVELLVPTGRRIPLVLNQYGIPLALQGRVSGVVRGERQAKEIARAFGRDHRPRKPLLVYGPSGRAILIVGGGDTEASEMQDLAQMAIARDEERLRKGLDAWFDELRTRHGLARREDAARLMKEAIEARIRRHQTNSVSDPARVPERPPA